MADPVLLVLDRTDPAAQSLAERMLEARRAAGAEDLTRVGNLVFVALPRGDAVRLFPGPEGARSRAGRSIPVHCDGRGSRDDGIHAYGGRSAFADERRN
jgi:hypothetical protein